MKRGLRQIHLREHEDGAPAMWIHRGHEIGDVGPFGVNAAVCEKRNQKKNDITETVLFFQFQLQKEHFNNKNITASFLLQQLCYQ